jgi:hypothetical protein
MMAHLKLFGDLSEGNSLRLDEALEGLYVTAATNQLPLILSQPPLVFYGKIIGKLILVF